MTSTFLASGFTPDAILNVTTTLILGLVSTAAAITIAVWQSRSNKRERHGTAAAWSKQVNDLTDKLDARVAAGESHHAAEIARHLIEHEKDRREIARLNRLLTKRGDDD